MSTITDEVIVLIRYNPTRVEHKELLTSYSGYFQSSTAPGQDKELRRSGKATYENHKLIVTTAS